eukprot:g400.t1
MPVKKPGAKKKKKKPLATLGDDFVDPTKKKSNKKNKGDFNFAKGSGTKGPGKSTALTGKKSLGKKAKAAKERYMKGLEEDEDDKAAKAKRAAEKKALAAARAKLKK